MIIWWLHGCKLLRIYQISISVKYPRFRFTVHLQYCTVLMWLIDWSISTSTSHSPLSTIVHRFTAIFFCSHEKHFHFVMVAQSLLRVSCLLVSIIQTTSFQFFQTARSSCYTSHSYLQMVAYPTKIRNVVTKMTESTQKALQKMNSR